MMNKPYIANEKKVIEVNNLSSKYLADLMKLPVQTNMRITPPTVSPSDTISMVVEKLVEQNVGAVIVVDKGQPVGIINEKDVMERVIKLQKDMDQTLVKDVMSKPLITIEADRPTQEALDLMHQHNIRRLAVTKDGALVGLVTERRLLQVAFLVV
jgi:CBS domain-containing protein